MVLHTVFCQYSHVWPTITTLLGINFVKCEMMHSLTSQSSFVSWVAVRIFSFCQITVQCYTVMGWHFIYIYSSLLFLHLHLYMLQASIKIILHCPRFLVCPVWCLTFGYFSIFLSLSFFHQFLYPGRHLTHADVFKAYFTFSDRGNQWPNKKVSLMRSFHTCKKLWATGAVLISKFWNLV